MSQTPSSRPAGPKKMSATEATVSSFFAIAQEDLEASNLLYDNKMYRPAVLLLQQAVEKAVKSLALQVGVIEPDGVRGIGHRPQDAYTDLIIQLSNNLTKSMKDIETREEMQVALALIGEDIRNVMDAVMEIKGQALRTADAYDRCDISDEQVCDLLDTMDTMNQEFYELDEIIQASLGEKEFGSLLFKGKIAVKVGLFLIPMNLADKQILSRQIDVLIEELPALSVFFESVFVLMVSQVTAAFSLFYLSLLTAPHAMAARYPDATKENIDPLEFYTEDTPLVAYLPDVLWFTGYTFDQMERFYSHLTYLPEIEREAFLRRERPPRLPKNSNPTALGGKLS